VIVELREPGAAHVRWGAEEFLLTISVPCESADDLSPFFAALLLPAMRLGEPLELRGAVSERLLERSELVQRICRSWDPGLARCDVRAGAAVARGPRASGNGCLFSRGVDSMYSAAIERTEPGPLTHLVYCDDISAATRHDLRVREDEIAATRAAADVFGLPLLVTATNVRTLTDPLISWEDVHGGVLASVALALEAELGHVVFPSWADPAGLAASGSHPLLDSLWSTESVEIEHDRLESRVAKVAWLASERPDLVRHLKVCLRENRADNCGRCRKCLLTMACLQAAGALDRATTFPPSIDLELVRAIRPFTLAQRLAWAQVAEALDAGPLREAILHGLRRAARPSPLEQLRRKVRRNGSRDPSWSAVWPRPEFSSRQTTAAASLLREGRPDS
jgi:hypothetical protein